MLKFPMLYKIITSLVFIGYFPFAPGSFAALFAMLFVFYLKPSDPMLFIILIATFFIGAIFSDKVEQETKKKDPPFIVIDEFVGYLTTIVFLPKTWQVLIAGFILFRFFDILKPPPIRQIEKQLKGGFGIMIDDVVAGVFANLLIRVYLLL